MKLLRNWGLLGLVLVLWPGCQEGKTPAAPPPATNAVSSAEAAIRKAATNGVPQAKLPTIKLWLGAEEIIVEQAVTEAQWATGMMFRKEMAENEGMLFIFPFLQRASFYMKNTLLPLAGAYIDSSGTILEIHDMKPLNESPIVASTDTIQYVLEMNKDWFARHKIGVGTVVRTERGSLEETYFRRR